MGNILKQNDFIRNQKKGLKVIGETNTVIHCHHYNARLQRTIEGNKAIDGKNIIKEAAATSYYKIIKSLITKSKKEPNIELAQDLYSFLGFGILDFSELNKGIVRSPSSHYVEGWQCGSIDKEGPVCVMTEGFIEGAVKAILNLDVDVSESCCLNERNEMCEFKVVERSSFKYEFPVLFDGELELSVESELIEAESNIDKEAIVNAVLNMELEGNNEGLIPAFNVYLAHTPQDFYNSICINFVKEMEKFGLREIAQNMLAQDAENCALNTFGGILDSDEWRALIQPMVLEKRDEIFGLVAVANSLGWGRINVVEHTAYESLELSSSNGYEAYGFIELDGYSNSSQCFMLQGVASGLMALIYEKGELEDRTDKYSTSECLCITKKDKSCVFKVKHNS